MIRLIFLFVKNHVDSIHFLLTENNSIHSNQRL